MASAARNVSTRATSTRRSPRWRRLADTAAMPSSRLAQAKAVREPASGSAQWPPVAARRQCRKPLSGQQRHPRRGSGIEPERVAEDRHAKHEIGAGDRDPGQRANHRAQGPAQQPLVLGSLDPGQRDDQHRGDRRRFLAHEGEYRGPETREAVAIAPVPRSPGTCRRRRASRTGTSRRSAPQPRQRPRRSARTTRTPVPPRAPPIVRHARPLPQAARRAARPAPRWPRAAAR